MQHFGDGQAQGGGQLFTHAATELFKGKALPLLEQLQFPKSRLGIKRQLAVLLVDAEALQVAIHRLAEGRAVPLGQGASGLVKQPLQQLPGVGLLPQAIQFRLGRFQICLALLHLGCRIHGTEAETQLFVVPFGREQGVFFGFESLAALLPAQAAVWAFGAT